MVSASPATATASSADGIAGIANRGVTKVLKVRTGDKNPVMRASLFALSAFVDSRLHDFEAGL